MSTAVPLTQRCGRIRFWLFDCRRDTPRSIRPPASPPPRPLPLYISGQSLEAAALQSGGEDAASFGAARFSIKEKMKYGDRASC